MQINKGQAVADEVVRIGGIGTGGAAVWTMTPAEMAAYATAFYFVAAGFYTLWKWFKEYRESRNVDKE